MFNRLKNWLRPAQPAKHIEIAAPADDAVLEMILKEAFTHGHVAYSVGEDGSLTRIDIYKDDQ